MARPSTEYTVRRIRELRQSAQQALGDAERAVAALRVSLDRLDERALDLEEALLRSGRQTGTRPTRVSPDQALAIWALFLAMKKSEARGASAEDAARMVDSLELDNGRRLAPADVAAKLDSLTEQVDFDGEVYSPTDAGQQVLRNWRGKIVGIPADVML